MHSAFIMIYTLSEYWPWILLISLVLHTLSTLYAWYRLRGIPGPFLAKFSKLWLINAVGSTHMDQQLCDVSLKYGTLVRIAPNILLTSDPEVIRKSNAVRTPYKRSTFYNAFRFDPSSDNIISQQDDELHRVLRANMAPGYSGKENENIESTIDSNVSTLINLIGNNYISSASEYKPIDFAQKVSLFTLDAIADIAFGKPFGNLATDTDVHGYISAIEKQGPFVVFTTNFPWLMNLLKSRIFRPLLPSPKDTNGFGRIMAVAHSVSTSRFLPNAKPQRDMLGSFVRNGMTLEECKSETILQIIAGSDTTATAIRMTFFHTISNPSILARLLEEIRDASLASDRVISDNEAKKLLYLQAVIKEGLRIHPPVAGHGSKIVPKGGDTLDGYFIPGGTEIGVSMWGTQRNREFWGEDADVFRPERWLEATPERAREMAATTDLVFSYGKWQCLGKNVAHMELNKVLVELLRNFTFSQCNPMNPFNSICYGVFLQKDMWLRVERRDVKL